MFDKAVAGLAEQGFQRSIAQDGLCKYRGPDGMRCAIGYLIPDDKYVPDMEFSSIARNNLVIHAIGVDLSDDSMLPWLTGLQRCHDHGHSTDSMCARLVLFARENALKIPAYFRDA